MKEFSTLKDARCGFCGRTLYAFTSRVRGAVFECGCGVRRTEFGELYVLRKSDDEHSSKWVEVPKGTLLVRER
jgi:hypothetical protein